MTYPPSAIVQDRETSRYYVLKLKQVLSNIPLYEMVPGRVFEFPDEAMRSASHLAGNIQAITTVETPCGERVLPQPIDWSKAGLQK